MGVERSEVDGWRGEGGRNWGGQMWSGEIAGWDGGQMGGGLSRNERMS